MKIIESFFRIVLVTGVFIIWLAMILFPARNALAQQVQMPMDSMWGVNTTQLTFSLSAVPLRRNATTGSFEAIPGQRVPISGFTLFQTSFTVTFPGQSSTPMNVSGMRLYHSAAGQGWVMPEHQINVVLPSTLIVPAGRRMACRYDAPIGRTGSLVCRVV